MIIYQDVKSNRGDYHRNEPIFVLYIGTELKDQKKTYLDHNKITAIQYFP